MILIFFFLNRDSVKMAKADESNNKCEEIRQELGIVLTNQISRLTEVTKRQDASIANFLSKLQTCLR